MPFSDTPTAMGQTLLHIKIGGKWIFIPLNMVGKIGSDTFPQYVWQCCSKNDPKSVGCEVGKKNDPYPMI